MKFFRFLFLFMAAVFTIPVILMSSFVGEHVENSKLAKTGISTTAHAYGADTNQSINGERIFYIKYSFILDGEEVKGETSSRYSYEEAKRIVGTDIEIKYNPTTLKSIEANYKKPPMLTIEIVVICIFGTVSLVLTIVFIVGVIGDIRRLVIKNTGSETFADFIDGKSNVTVNGVAKYKVFYKYKNENGLLILDKTPSMYNYDEMDYYRQVGKFKIKFKRGKSAIIEKPFSNPIPEKSETNVEFSEFDNEDLENFDHNELPSTESREGHISIDTENKIDNNLDYERVGHASIYDKEVLCEHCGCYVPENKRKCPNCGAKMPK